MEEDRQQNDYYSILSFLYKLRKQELKLYIIYITWKVNYFFGIYKHAKIRSVFTIKFVIIPSKKIRVTALLLQCGTNLGDSVECGLLRGYN